MVLPSSARPRRRVAVVVDKVAETAELYESTVVSSLGDVREALRSVGFEPVVVEFDGEPSSWLGALQDGSFDLVFNLCEGLSGQGSEEPLAAGAVELLGLPLTGARAFTLGLCLRKDLVNGHLRARGIAVPDWALAEAGPPLAWRAFPAIVKPAAEDASLGIDDHSVAHDASELAAALERGHRTWDRLLVQRYVEGREFNLAVVGDQVLPPSEILWALPEGHPHIVSYAAKWETSSVDYRGTTPGWLGASEGRLAARLHRLATRVWAAVDGAGYGRIDVRMDGRGRLYVIEVNPNPDLSPDAGLARQASAAGWSYPELIGRIAELAFTTEGALARERGARRQARRREAVR
ncbi:MAG: D-alanine--D-alanine ligase [Solirubrobacterales bacterium]